MEETHQLGLAVDVETTGLESPDVERIIEVGLCLFDFVTKKPLEMYGVLVREPDLEPLKPEIVKLTGIEMESVERLGKEPHVVVQLIKNCVKKCDLVLAHNASFDKGMLEGFFKRHDPEGTAQTFFELPWVCSRSDITYPSEMRSKALNYLACDHGFVNPFKHRALMDVLTMLRVVENYDLEEAREMACSPLLKIKAKVSFDERALAKEQGFQWDPKGRIWFKDIREKRLNQERENYPFSYDMLQ